MYIKNKIIPAEILKKKKNRKINFCVSFGKKN